MESCRRAGPKCCWGPLGNRSPVQLCGTSPPNVPNINTALGKSGQRPHWQLLIQKQGADVPRQTVPWVQNLPHSILREWEGFIELCEKCDDDVPAV